MSEPLETYATHEKQYEQYSDRFLKRTVWPHEYKQNIHKETIVPFGCRERLENEAASLQFIKNVTNIPVPKVLEACDKDGSFHLSVELVPGVLIPAEHQAVVIAEVEKHMKTLQSLKRNHVGGPTGIIALPPMMTGQFEKNRTWTTKSFPVAEYVFCHQDLSQGNIIVNPETLQIAGIIDWEYAGFYPEYAETPFFRDSKFSGIQAKYLTKIAELKKFFFVSDPFSELKRYLILPSEGVKICVNHGHLQNNAPVQEQDNG